MVTEYAALAAIAHAKRRCRAKARRYKISRFNAASNRPAVIPGGVAASLFFVPLLRDGRHEVEEPLSIGAL